MTSIQYGEVERDDRGCAYSPEFGDIYATRDGAYDQARFVFLGGNGLPERWQGSERFTILENGFGLGTNFLATLKAWREDPRRSDRLNYVSIEGFPLSARELIDFAAPQLKQAAQELAERWPDRTPGVHQIFFDDGRVTLTLYFMDALTAAKKLCCGFDAFYPDGFAPSKNPAMWEPRVIKTLASHAHPNATLATWCVASAVRQSLKDASFEVEKVPGFGHKAQMLKGVFKPRNAHRRKKSLFLPLQQRPKSALVIGAGLAGSACADVLSQRGLKVTVIDAGPVAASGASALRWGVAHAQPSRDDNYLFRLSRSGLASLRRVLETYPTLCDLNGMFQMARDEAELEKWQQWIKQGEPFPFPDDFLRLVSLSEVRSRLGLSPLYGGLWHGGAGIAAVSRLCRARIEHSGAQVLFNTKVQSVQKAQGRWRVLDANGLIAAEADLLVICAAADSARLAGTAPVLHSWKGRISLLPEDTFGSFEGAVTGPGYFIHARDGWTGVGATYEQPGEPMTTEQAHEKNLAHLKEFFPGERLPPGVGFYEGFRCVTPDRLPLVGSVAHSESHADTEGLYMCCAMGSRGTVLSELSAQLIAAQIFDDPLPLESDLLRAITPDRFTLNTAIDH